MRAKWSELLVPLRFELINQSKKSCDTIHPHEIANTLIGLSELGVNWNDLNQSYKESLEKGLIRVIYQLDKQGVAKSIYALGIMEVHWSDLSLTSQVELLNQSEKMIHYMTAKEVSNITIGFNKMKVDLKYLKPSFLKLLENK